MEDPLIRWNKPYMKLNLRVHNPSAHYNDKDKYIVLHKFTSNTLKLPQSSYNSKTKKIHYGSHSQKCYACCSNKIAAVNDKKRNYNEFLKYSIREATS
jgi:hypothetical protein